MAKKIIQATMAAIVLSVTVAIPLRSQDQWKQVDIHAPYVATPDPVVHAMLSMAKTKSTDIVYDLGCGDGRIVIAAAKNYGARGVGVDINPKRIQEARANARRAGVEHLVQFREGDVFEVDVKPATVVALYLLPDMNLKLRPQLKELKPGARVVTHTFAMGDWKPQKQADIDGYPVFLWKIRKRFWLF